MPHQLSSFGAGRMAVLAAALLALAAVLCPVGAGAQSARPERGSAISGTVVDSATGRPLDRATVFLGSTMLGASTDQNGAFQLRGIPNGSYQIACSRVGYTRRLVPVEFTRPDSIQIEIALVQRPIALDTVRVTGIRPDDRRRYLKVFLKAFLGRRPNAEKCTLLNPEVIDFRMDRRAGLLAASTDSVLRIDNRALGYRVDVLLIEFSWDVRRDTGRWAVVPHFKPFDSADAEEQIRWRENRREAFAGSLDHFLAALATGRPDDQGFITGYRGRGLPSRLPTLAPVPGTSLVSVTFTDWLRVEYARSSPTIKSSIRLVEDCAVIDSLGNNFTPYCLEISGDWAKYGIADMLPRDWN